LDVAGPDSSEQLALQVDVVNDALPNLLVNLYEVEALAEPLLDRVALVVHVLDLVARRLLKEFLADDASVIVSVVQCVNVDILADALDYALLSSTVEDEPQIVSIGETRALNKEFEFFAVEYPVY